MQGLNIIWVFNPAMDRVLMCKRHKEPYLGLFNLPGGKIEQGESGMDAAYRELLEETGIDDIYLQHLMDFTYHMSWSHSHEGVRVEVYVGRIERDVEVMGDERELVWLDINEDFFDKSRFAGEGNIGHVFEQIKLHWERIDKNE